MRYLLSVSIILLTINVSANNMTLSAIRNSYIQALNEEGACNNLLNMLESVNDKSPAVKGYYGACMMVSAKYTLNPLKKFSLFNKGREILESAIENDNTNAELRFLRLGIQNNAPSFLGYNKSIEPDKLFLISAQATLSDPELKKLIISYLVDMGYIKTEKS
jgi:hypothetical protein